MTHRPLSALLSLVMTLAAFVTLPAYGAGGYPAPDICDRECWQARPPQGTVSQMSGLNRAVIHYTAFADNYYTESLEESAANVRGVQNYHMDVNGWTDIGYHFLGDVLGNAFEGRPGSIESYPRGAHDGNNDKSFGFCLMGYFHEPHDQEPPEALRCTIYDLIAWKLPDPFDGFGSSVYDGDTTGYLAGHRDVKATSCPGDLMYNQYIGTDFEGGEARLEVNARINTGDGLMCGGGPQCCPSAPTLDGAFASGSGAIALTWSDLGSVEGYRVYRSDDGISFNRVGSTDPGETTFLDGSINPGQAYFYRITAVGSLYESDPSDVYGARTALTGAADSLLIVDGNDRWRTQAENPESLNHSFTAQVALSIPSSFPFDTADNDPIAAGDVPLGDYDGVIWLLGEESTVHETFSAQEQAWVRSYRNGGGALFVSGAEIGWDLAAQGSSADQSFYEEVLLANYVADDANSTEATATQGGPFEGLSPTSFVGGALVVEYPDVIEAAAGAVSAFSYGSTGSAADPIAGVAAPGLVHLAFPFEAIADANQRGAMMTQILDYFDLETSGPSTRVHIETVSVTVKGRRDKRAIAAVSVVDAAGRAVSGATVSGSFEGMIDEAASGTSNDRGTAYIPSSPFSDDGGPLSFCVEVVSGPGLSYDEAADLEVCAEL